MSEETYFYFGIGVITIFVIAGAVGIFYVPSNGPYDSAEITIQLYSQDSAMEFSSHISEAKLFSENTTVLNFSPAGETSGLASFSEFGFDCEITCRKG